MEMSRGWRWEKQLNCVVLSRLSIIYLTFSFCKLPGNFDRVPAPIYHPQQPLYSTQSSTITLIPHD